MGIENSLRGLEHELFEECYASLGRFMFGRKKEAKHELPRVYETDSGDRVLIENYSDVVKKYLSPVIGKIKGYFSRVFGFTPLFRNVRIRIEKLPSRYLALIERVGDRIRMYIRPVGKVFGYYDAPTQTIGIDPCVFPELNDPEREVLKKYEMLLTPERVIGEEFVHNVQHRVGVMDRLRKYAKKARDYIEGAAAYVSDRLFGRTNIYTREKREYEKLVEKCGEKRAFLGGC